ncbi:101 kDa malaria antigen-like [Aphidius gifuensis]|uniref:101 kDa malaria antigen-like n=1 Tax=Aphidius gifuensis TaxID=684658 RepID=UPI001CDBC4A8|nr:101 kDa malaria antigen-like [Aphidius gifuensis]
MGINSNGMNMKSADLIPSEWHEKFITFLKKENKVLETFLDDKVIESMEMEFDDYYDYGKDDTKDDDDDSDDGDENDSDDTDDDDDNDNNKSISEIKNLDHLELRSRWPKNHPMFDTRINMYPIGNMKNLEYLNIDCDYGVRDEFLINLCNNAKKLELLTITGTYITDIGMSAVNNLEQLEEFNLVLKLVENLPNLTDLSIKNTKVTRQAFEKIYKLTKQRKKPLKVHHSFKNND